MPPGGVIKPGGTDQQVALLRQRLKVAAEDKAKENVYDAKLQEAVREFQRANNLRPDAVIGNNTRAVLNGQPKPEPVTANSKIERILVNMERWRWLPEDLGKLYVWDNVPEALTRIVKDGKIIHTDKLVVGQPTWPTPSFSADMKTVVFHPTWGVPDGIKAKELAPLLRKSSGGGIFGLFGGGYSADAVLDAYQLHAYVNGHQVDANSIDWSSIDIRSVAFQQPPGPKNPLGNVKFMFPNKHDVYMHDTPEHELFSRSFRALSHGCMRVQDPRRFAEIILGEDKGWSPEKVRGMFAGGSQDVPLDTHIPVHVTYLTMRVDENGKLQTYGDFYGLDGRTAAALTGKAVRFEQPAIQDDVVASGRRAPATTRLFWGRRASAERARKKQYGARRRSPMPSRGCSRPNRISRVPELRARTSSPSLSAARFRSAGKSSAIHQLSNSASTCADLRPGRHPECYDVGAAHGQRRRMPSLGRRTRRARAALSGRSPERAQSISAPSTKVSRAVAVEKCLRFPLAGRRIESGLASGHVGEPIGFRSRKAQALLQASGVVRLARSRARRGAARGRAHERASPRSLRDGASRSTSTGMPSSGAASSASRMARAASTAPGAAKQPQELGADALARKPGEPGFLRDRGCETFGVRGRPVAVLGEKAEEAQDAQVVLADALRWHRR